MSNDPVYGLVNQENVDSFLAKLGQDFLTAYLGKFQIQTAENNAFIPNKESSEVVEALKLESKQLGKIHYIVTAPLQLADFDGFFFAISYDSPIRQLGQ